MQALNQPQDWHADSDGNSRYLSSQDLARGVEVQELSLRDVSNGHLQELLRMLQGWRQRATMATPPFGAAASV